MVKGFGVSVTLILLLASASLAEIDQGQLLGIIGTNGVALVDAGVADSTNITTASQLQDASAYGGLVRSVQFQVGTLGQVAAVGGTSGGIGMDQYGAAQLGQAQGATPLAGVQNQAAGIVLNDALAKVGGGSGIGIGLQAFVGAQYQVTAGPAGISMNVNIPIATTLQLAHY